MSKEEWPQAANNRKEIFRPIWFRKLVGGKFSLGDTFWIGNFGVPIVFALLGFAILLILSIFTGENEQAASYSIAVMMVLLVIYYALLVRAVFTCAVRTPQVGAWRWVGLAFTMGQLATISMVAFFMLSFT